MGFYDTHVNRQQWTHIDVATDDDEDDDDDEDYDNDDSTDGKEK